MYAISHASGGCPNAIKIFFEQRRMIKNGINIIVMEILEEFKYSSHAFKSFLPKAWDTSVSIPPQKPTPNAKIIMLFVIMPSPHPDKNIYTINCFVLSHSLVSTKNGVNLSRAKILFFLHN